MHIYIYIYFFYFPMNLIVQSMRPTCIFKIFPEFMVCDFWPRNFEYASASLPIWSCGTKAQQGAWPWAPKSLRKQFPCAKQVGGHFSWLVCLRARMLEFPVRGFLNAWISTMKTLEFPWKWSEDVGEEVSEVCCHRSQCHPFWSLIVPDVILCWCDHGCHWVVYEVCWCYLFLRSVQYMDVFYNFQDFHQASQLRDGKALTLHLMDMRHWERQDTQIKFRGSWTCKTMRESCIFEFVGIRVVYVWLKFWRYTYIYIHT